MPALVALFALAGPGGSNAEAGRRRNMPDGWSWPPSAAMRRAGTRCTEALTAAEVAWRPGPRTRAIATPVLVPGMELGGLRLVPTHRRPPFVMDCHLALALAEHGQVLRQLGVVELRFSTIHEYRRIRLGGRRSKALSRHSLGLAIDVFEIVTETGERISVAKRYRKGEPTLRAVEKSVVHSLAFRHPLTPGNSPRSHGDHFHLEARVDYRGDRHRTAALARPHEEVLRDVSKASVE